MTHTLAFRFLTVTALLAARPGLAVAQNPAEADAEVPEDIGAGDRLALFYAK